MIPPAIIPRFGESKCDSIAKDLAVGLESKERDQSADAGSCKDYNVPALSDIRLNKCKAGRGRRVSGTPCEKRPQRTGLSGGRRQGNDPLLLAPSRCLGRQERMQTPPGLTVRGRG